ncbi:vacuolar-sorting receptor 1-like protein [Tanacetum coccineum]
MDIRDEIKASKVDKLTQSSLLPDSNVLPKSSLLPDSDQNNPLNKPQLSSGVKGINCVSPIKSKDTSNSDSPRRRRITMSERDMLVGIASVVSDKLNDLEKDKVNVGKDMALKHKLTDLEKDKVYVGKDKAPKHKAPVKNPTAIVYKARKQKTSDKKLAAVVKKPNVVVDKAPKHKAPAKKSASVVVQDKDNVTTLAKEPTSVMVQDKDNVVVNDPAELDQEKDKEKHKVMAKEPASVVGRVCDVSKQIMFHVEDALKNKAADVKEKSDGKGKKSTVDKDNDKAKEPASVVGSVCNVVKEIAFDVVNEKSSDALKNKATDVKKKSVGKGKKSTVDKPNDNAPNPNDNKSKAHSDVVPVAEKPKPNPKQKEKSTVQELSEVPVLRSSNQKVNPDVKSKVVVRVSKSKETPVKRKRIVSKEDDRKKKLKGKSKKEDSDSELETDVVDSSSDEADRKRKKLKIKAGLKRKRSGSDSSDSSSIDTAKVKRLISKLEKKVKKQESDEESVPKKGFSSLHNVSIDQLPSKLGWFVVSKFKNYMLSLDTGDKIEVTRQKIHDMLGVPVGSYSLFDLDEREADHEFVKLWVGQFHPVELRDLRVNDITQKLVAAKDIDFLFKVNFLTLFTNTMGKADGLKGQICLDVVRRLREDFVISDIDWCGYIYDCLRDSKLPSGTNHYLGPLTFLILLYLDSTKFDRFHVVHTRLANRNWSTYLMKQRQESELKDRMLGILDLHVEWTEVEVQEAEGFIGSLEISKKEDLIKKAEEKLSLICAERVMLEDYMRKASLKCPGDGKFVALHEKYVNLFKDPISFKDDGNRDNVGDDDENGDDDDGNVDEEDVNEAEKDKVVEGNPTEQGTVVEGNQDEECEIGDKMVIQSKSHEIHSEFHMIHSESHVIHSEYQNVFEAHFGKFIVFEVRLNLETLAPGLWLDANVIDYWGAVLNHEESFQVVESKSKHFFLTGCISKSIFDETLASFDAKWESFSNQVNAQFKGNKGGLALGGKKLFARHLKQYGHIRHTQVARVKHTIPKLKWKTKENFHDCGIFTMLHMETFDGGLASNLDCGLLVESQLQRDMLRRLRFKFATKILLHEINVHAGKMLELAKEFDKTDPAEKMRIIVDALKNREERDCI